MIYKSGAPTPIWGTGVVKPPRQEGSCIKSAGAGLTKNI
nr:MAG TPA: hypothetical protein [Caudoviricetes sp.]